MSVLLQKLLHDRDVVMLLYHKWVLCSCGEKFEEYTDAENHLVSKHQRRQLDDITRSPKKDDSNNSNQNMDKMSLQKKDTERYTSNRVSSRTILDGLDDKEKLINIKVNLLQIKSILEQKDQMEFKENHQENNKIQSSNTIKKRNQADITPFTQRKIVPIVLEENEINSGQIKDEECHDCRYKASNFQELKSHYSQQHHQSWTHDTEEILTTKPKSHLEGWQYRYYCPIPGCIHHILKCLEEDENDSRKSHRLKDDNKNGSNDTNDLKQKIKSRHFINITSLKQHYSKVHAHRGISCNICKSKSAVFATASQLEKHKTSLCGKKFICTTCKRQYGGLEHLQTHCRRKGHMLPAHLFNHIKNKRSSLHENTQKAGSSQAYITFQNPASTMLNSSQILQPLVFQLMSSATKPVSMTNQCTKPNDEFKIIKKSSVDNAKRKLKGDNDAKSIKKSHVKIAPKPSVTMTFPLLNHVSTGSASGVISGNEVVLAPSNSNLTSMSNTFTINTNIHGDSKQAIIPSITNSRPPCPVQLSAAIALSELAAKTGDLTSAEGDNAVNQNTDSLTESNRDRQNHEMEHDKTQVVEFQSFNKPTSSTLFHAVGTSTDQSNINGRDLAINKPLTNSLHVQCPDWTSSSSEVNCLIQTTTEEQETQTFCSDKLLSQNQRNTFMSSWTGVAATQTSPGNIRLSDAVESASDLLSCFADASTATSPEPKLIEEGTEDSLLRPFQRGRGRTYPRLGDIEQFSTETQTDDFDLLKIATSEDTSVRGDTVDKMVEDEDDPFTSFKRELIEATTQFDLDDILCSNYTQTCPELLGSEDDDPMMSILVRPTDAENNSVVSIRSNIGTKTTKSTSSVSMSTTESQTQTSTYYGIGECDNDNIQISMDIETQTGSLL